MDKLRYTTEAPTVPGYYWLKKRYDYEGEIISLEILEGGSLSCFYIGVAEPLADLHYFPEARWAGPIPLPSDD